LAHLIKVVTVLNHLAALDHVSVVVLPHVQHILVLLAIQEVVVLLGLVVDVLSVSLNTASVVISLDLLGAIRNARHARLILPHDRVKPDWLPLARHHAHVHDGAPDLDDLGDARLQGELVLNLNHGTKFAHIIFDGELLTVEGDHSMSAR
jgi:hypothetical protein